MPDLLYLDYNCFQRSFDDSRQARIRMEAAACERIFEKAEEGSIDLVWSFMHEDENALCPFVDRKLEAERLAALCRTRVGPSEAVRALARDLALTGLPAKDAVHVAAAAAARAGVFVTCDDELLRKAARLALEMDFLNPVQYVMRKG